MNNYKVNTNVLQALLSHIRSQIFVTSTGIAAYIHSTWALAVTFGGLPPDPSTPEGALAYAWWVLPAALIAFALDIGQIVTAHEIRMQGGRASPLKYLTFLIFAGATYYLQWYYLVHHMPALELSPGVRFEREAAETLASAAVWLIPALLPLSTLLYTLSGREDIHRMHPAQLVPSRSTRSGTPGGANNGTVAAAVSKASQNGAMLEASCGACGKVFRKPDQVSLTKALAGHSKNCRAKYSNVQIGVSE
jgi:hypothetical protein